MTVGLSQSPVAGDKPRSEPLGEGEVYAVGNGMSAPQLVSTCDQWLYRPTPNRHASKVGDSDESFVIADQPAHNRSPYRPDDLDVEMGGRMHRLALQASSHRRARPGRENEFYSR